VKKIKNKRKFTRTLLKNLRGNRETLPEFASMNSGYVRIISAKKLAILKFKSINICHFDKPKNLYQINGKAQLKIF